MAIARFSLAVDRRFKKEGEPTADFINCVAFGKVAEIIEKYVFKGTKLIVNGEWKTGSYTNKDGNKVYTNDCVINNIEFAESKNASMANSNGASNSTPADASNADFMKIDDFVSDEGLPFE